MIGGAARLKSPYLGTARFFRRAAILRLHSVGGSCYAAAMPPPADETELPPVAVMWENFGPTHHDRLRALARAGFDVDAIELSSNSRSYLWEREEAAGYRVHTLDDRPGGASGPGLFLRLVKVSLRSRARHVFLCHYERPLVFAAAVTLRLLGRRVYAMFDSKFDDYPRFVGREYAKSWFLAPYRGALVASRRSRDYLAFLGVPRRRIELGYDTIEIARLAGAGADADTEFAARPFLVVARLISKKNIPLVLEAFARYRGRYADKRELHIVGYGPLEEDLRREVDQLGLGEAVRFFGLKGSAEVASAMARALALVLASTEEQFGLVVNEALAVGLPVIVSSNAGATDVLVENLGNGIVIDPHDPETIVLAMAHMAGDEGRWLAMRERARETAMRGDASRFSEGIGRLVRSD